MSVALVGARDTVYRTTDASGVFTFTDVPSGSWTLIVMAETPTQTQWEPERFPSSWRLVSIARSPSDSCRSVAR